MVTMGDVVTVNLTTASNTFRSAVTKHYFGVVNYLSKADDDITVANVSWFSDECGYSMWWAVDSLVPVIDSTMHVVETLAGDFQWLNDAIENYKLANPL